MRTVALVESPTQLLNVIEWAASARCEPAVHVLAPRDGRSLHQLAAVADLATAAGLPVSMHRPRAGAAGLAGFAATMARQLPRAGRVVIGDPFSALVHRLLPLVRAGQIVVVDDGTATWEFAARIDAGRPLVRWRAEPAQPPRRAVRATRALSPSAHRSLGVFSALSDAAPRGGSAIGNEYRWTRAQGTPTVRAEEVDLVGASMVETGLVHRVAYVDAVVALAARYGASRYFAHRRESDEKLRMIAGRSGLRIVRPATPVEHALRTGTVAGQVITFPSTATHTLPIVLAGTGVRVEVFPVRSSWFTPTTSLHARRFVERITERSQAGTVLGAISM